MQVVDGPPAVVLGGGVNAVSILRTLSTAGLTVHVVGTKGSLARHSRHCRSFVDLGSGDGMQARWLEWLRSGPRGAVLLPCSDDGLELVARHRAELVELGYRPIEANDEALLAMLDKDRTYELARELGVPAPRTASVGDAAELERVASEFSYPCALKPLHSHVWARHFTGKVVRVSSPEELRSGYARMRELGIEVLVTEIIPGGEDHYETLYTYLDEDGQPLFRFTKQKLRQYPPGFGLGTYHITNRNEHVMELGLRFLQGVGVRGLAMVEFKRDANTGEYKIIECNHRFTAVNELLRNAGLDLARFTYSRLAGVDGPALDDYRTGVTLWSPVDDMLAALILRRRGELSLRTWVRGLLRPQHVPVFRLDDPKPSIVEFARLGQRGWRKFVRHRGTQLGSPPAAGSRDDAASAPPEPLASSAAGTSPQARPHGSG